MAVKLRLMRMGKTKQPTYRVVAADSRSPRNGRFIEIVGTYEPRQEPSKIVIDNDKAVGWLRKGAQPTDRVQRLLQISGAWDEFKGAKPFVSDADDVDDDVDGNQIDGNQIDDSWTNVDDGDDGDGLDDNANRVPAATARDVCEYLVKAVVEDPDGVEVDVAERGRGTTIEVRVTPGDMGRVIGKRGRIAQSIRTVVRAAAVRDGASVDVDFVE